MNPRRYGPVFWLLLAVSVPNMAFAAKVPVPEAIPDVVTLSAESLIEFVQQEPNLVVIDSRQRMDRRQGYLQGSISLPDAETTCASLAALISSLDTPTAFYCNGVKCGRSVIAVNTAKDCGYSQLYWFRGGFEEWKQKGYPFLKR